VYFGRVDIPPPGAPATGPLLKLQQLSDVYENVQAGFNLLYLGSSALPRDVIPLIRLARRKGIPIVVNQNGVGYPAWAGERWEAFNRPLRAALTAADHVLYQSSFCKEDADRYLGPPRGTWEILHNAVDVTRFVPALSANAGGPVILAGGDQQSPRRLELALAAFEIVRERHPEARLLVPGRLPSDAGGLLERFPARGAVDLLGTYAHADGPALYRRANVLLHTKVNDPCPNVVLEALASGLPVVHPASGGTPELVGDAGVAVTHVASHEELLQPTAEALADAVDVALAHRERLAGLARERAVALFSLERWLERHALLFAELLARRPAR
jgi:glycosyltransferase involved in cell wall biosynthesis